jgi:hypothetical protein
LYYQEASRKMSDIGGEQAGRWLQSTGSGARWLLVEVVQPGLIVCKNEVQLRQRLLGVHFKRLEGSETEYDYAWMCGRGRWDYAYAERSAALRLLQEEEGENPTAGQFMRHVISRNK